MGRTPNRKEPDNTSLTTPDHPGNGNRPSSHEDDSEDSSTCTITRGDVVEDRHLLVRAVGTSIGITLRGTTSVRGEGGPTLEGDEVGIEDSQHRHLLLQTSGAVSGLCIPLGTAEVTTRTRRASLDRSLRRSLQLRQNRIRDSGHDRSKEGQPTGEVGLERDLVTIALVDRFAGDLHQDVASGTVVALGGIELTGGTHQAVNAFLPLGGGSVGLY